VQLVPQSELNSIVSSDGLTPLQVAALRGDIHLTKALLDTACLNIEGVVVRRYNGGTNYWTPLTFAALAGRIGKTDTDYKLEKPFF
jgi:ankyrin repeat protein